MYIKYINEKFYKHVWPKPYNCLLPTAQYCEKPICNRLLANIYRILPNVWRTFAKTPTKEALYIYSFFAQCTQRWAGCGWYMYVFASTLLSLILVHVLYKWCPHPHIYSHATPCLNYVFNVFEFFPKNFKRPCVCLFNEWNMQKAIATLIY